MGFYEIPNPPAYLYFFLKVTDLLLLLLSHFLFAFYKQLLSSLLELSHCLLLVKDSLAKV